MWVSTQKGAVFVLKHFCGIHTKDIKTLDRNVPVIQWLRLLFRQKTSRDTGLDITLMHENVHIRQMNRCFIKADPVNNLI